jgi:hypothetical protein
MAGLRSICTYTAVMISLWGCSGADGYPAPVMEDDFTAPSSATASADTDAAVRSAEATPAAEACEGDGAVGSCMAVVGTSAGFVLCAQGARTCSRGEWTACSTRATSAPVSGWEPESVGCNSPPEPCETDGESRGCVKLLPSSPEASNCYHGTQTCSGHVWGPCVP